MAVQLAKELASEGVLAFILLSLLADTSAAIEAQMIAAIQGAGHGASIRMMQISRHELDHYLFPQEVDLVIDCLVDEKDHARLLQSCAAQGLPIVLAKVHGDVLRVALIDPHAKNLSLLFEDPRPTSVPTNPIPQDSVTKAVKKAAELALLALRGEARFYGATLWRYTALGEQGVRECLPLAIPKYPRMIMVGSDRRKLSKSTLCAALARALIRPDRPIRMLKIANEGSVVTTQFLEESRDEEKPRIRAFFDAGCERVARLIVSESNIEQDLHSALADIYETMDRNGILLCESNTARRFLQPGLFVHLTAPDGHVKPSATLTRRLADLLIEAPYSDDDVAMIAEAFNRNTTEK